MVRRCAGRTLSTCPLLARLSWQSLHRPTSAAMLEQQVSSPLRAQCPEVKWRARQLPAR
jgi:hypothetical protein